jgi:hypothetical protein
MRASVSTLHHQTWGIHCSNQNQFARPVSMVIQFANAYRKKNVETVQKMEISSVTEFRLLQV